MYVLCGRHAAAPLTSWPSHALGLLVLVPSGSDPEQRTQRHTVAAVERRSAARNSAVLDPCLWVDRFNNLIVLFVRSLQPCGQTGRTAADCDLLLCSGVVKDKDPGPSDDSLTGL